jgi:hypothetical protein
MFADHLYRTAKLFQAAGAELTTTAVCQIMHTHAIAWSYMPDIAADFFDPARDFVPQRYR